MREGGGGGGALLNSRGELKQFDIPVMKGGEGDKQVYGFAPSIRGKIGGFLSMRM